ncbi:glyoxalase/bleomycin resistance/dioxygenase family protein [Rhodopseudomonas palustris]|uniref:Glyoxalase/bleomycin resistance/dioxygenase family protein n=1 Tax=Rhodopseudomonas palustris TaxID=1076 RepID=A0A323UG01_RHOPL|nr:VOC family protein [Rhodopseudomonas palustris]PZA10460.1 glyoxalase/bleomycin resistance/dioxygenase family protein [Rhodopseudomonas palustris]
MKLKQVYLTANDPKRLAEFYEGLGLKVRFADSDKWIQFVSDAAAFCVAGPTESVSEQLQDAVLVFDVDNLEAAMQRAAAAGARVDTVRDMASHGRAVKVRDPGGNVIQFYQAAG